MVRIVSRISLTSLLYGLAEGRRRIFHPRFDHFRILSDGQVRILVLVVEDPAFTFGDDLVPKFLSRDLVSPLTEGALGEFLNVALVNQRDDFRGFSIACRIAMRPDVSYQSLRSA